MKKPALSATVKTRIPAAWKAKLEAEARHDGLDLSDILRRALGQYIASHTATAPDSETEHHQAA